MSTTPSHTAVYGASEGAGGQRIIENSTGYCICFLRAKLHMVGSGDSNSYGRRLLHMVGRPLTVENGAGACLGRQIEAAQQLRVERDDDR